MGDGSKIQEEKNLISACLRGKASAQEKLFKKYYGLMLGISLRYATDRDDAKDILQDGFIKIFSKLDQYQFKGSFIGWMRRIMVNTAIDKYRKRGSEPYTTDVYENINIPASEDVISKISHEDLLNCLTRLPLGYRTVFNLYVIEGFSHKEIAEKLNISEGTSKSQLFKAKRVLMDIVKNEFGPNE